MEITPCPINEKDLCSDTIFEGLYDNNEYTQKDTTCVGFIEGMVAKATYMPLSYAVLIVGESQICGKIQERINEWMKAIVTSVNENIPVEDNESDTGLWSM